MRGRKIFRNSEVICFAQTDRMGQLCDLREFNQKNPYEKRIGAPIERQILSDFRGQPLILAWSNLIEALRLPENKEEETV